MISTEESWRVEKSLGSMDDCMERETIWHTGMKYIPLGVVVLYLTIQENNRANKGN